MTASSAQENAFELELPAGRVVLSQFEVLGKLAQGGMAEVYLAKRAGALNRENLSVIKRVKPELSDNESFVAMFANEARLAALIDHPNVVRIIECGQSDNDWVLAMEFLDGRDMLQIGRACRSLNKAVPFDVTARIVADACDGLDHAHRLVGEDGEPLNLVHRDMSPENILITFDGMVKVLDFGIAKAADNTQLTQVGQVKGKLGYVAPEAIQGKKLDARADIFAIGATLYLFLCGRPAYSGSNPVEVFENSLKPPIPLTDINERIPKALEDICLRCLKQDREERYENAAELSAALNEYLAGTGRQLGAPQLAQFMRILFPADRDPTRQKVEGLLRDAHERADAAPAAEDVPGPPDAEATEPSPPASGEAQPEETEAPAEEPATPRSPEAGAAQSPIESESQDHDRTDPGAKEGATNSDLDVEIDSVPEASLASAESAADVKANEETFADANANGDGNIDIEMDDADAAPSEETVDGDPPGPNDAAVEDSSESQDPDEEESPEEPNAEPVPEQKPALVLRLSVFAASAVLTSGAVLGALWASGQLSTLGNVIRALPRLIDKL